MKSKMSLRWVLVILAAVMIVLFCLPMGALEIMGVSTNISGLNLAFGSGLFEGSILEVVGLIAPIAIILLWIIKKEQAGKLSAIIAIVDVLVLIANLFIMSAKVDPASIGITICFIIYEILGIAITILSFLVAKGSVDVNSLDVDAIKGAVAQEAQGIKNGNGINFDFAGNDTPQNTGSSSKQKTGGNKCPKCGSPLDPDAMFCVECGCKIERVDERICPYCKRELDEDEIYCPSCGTEYYNPKKRVCPSCGKVLTPDQDFCPGCGSKYFDTHARICKSCGTPIKIDGDYCSKCGTKWEK